MTGETAEIKSNNPCCVLSLDGGGAKGFYTLGVLHEVEALTGKPLCEGFGLIFGTSTGAIIAALLGLGCSVAVIHELYREYVPYGQPCGEVSPAEPARNFEGCAVNPPTSTRSYGR
jgi:patatin-like phospholipase/acyl hydrolase